MESNSEKFKNYQKNLLYIQEATWCESLGKPIRIKEIFTHLRKRGGSRK